MYNRNKVNIVFDDAAHYAYVEYENRGTPLRGMYSLSQVIYTVQTQLYPGVMQNDLNVKTVDYGSIPKMMRDQYNWWKD